MHSRETEFKNADSWVLSSRNLFWTLELPLLFKWPPTEPGCGEQQKHSSFFYVEKSIFPHPSSFPLHSEMNVYSILIAEGTNYGTWLCTSRLYRSSKWGYILLISAAELGHSVIFLFLRNWVICFILLTCFFLMTPVCTTLLLSVSKGLVFTS